MISNFLLCVSSRVVQVIYFLARIFFKKINIWIVWNIYKGGVINLNFLWSLNVVFHFQLSFNLLKWDLGQILNIKNVFKHNIVFFV